MTTETTPRDEEFAKVLRGTRQTISDLQTSLVAFGDPKWSAGLERDFERAARALKWLDEVLSTLPPPAPLTESEERAIGKFVGAVLDKRFGDGSDEAVSAALDEWNEAHQ